MALLELESIARGLVVADALLKRSPVQLVSAGPTTPGKYLLLISGEVAEVEEALKAGSDAAGTTLLDTLFLPYAHRGLLTGLGGKFSEHRADDSVGALEFQTAAATLRAADLALKKADVRLTHLHLSKGIGGKGWFTLGGDLHMVQAALEAVSAAIPAPFLLGTELIQRPHPELRGPVL